MPMSPSLLVLVINTIPSFQIPNPKCQTITPHQQAFQFHHIHSMAPFPTLFLFLFSFFFIININANTNAAAAKKSSSIQQFLSRQNAARSALGLPTLVWDPRVARFARGYARSRRRDCALEHSKGPYGENLFWGSGKGWTPGQAVAAWVAERRGYNYGSNTCAYGRDECGHYTQIVWRESRRIGCARVVCSAGKGVFITCNYDPPGNYIGERPY